MGCKCMMTLWALLAKYLLILYCGGRNLLATGQVSGGAADHTVADTQWSPALEDVKTEDEQTP